MPLILFFVATFVVLYAAAKVVLLALRLAWLLLRFVASLPDALAAAFHPEPRR